jgi:hypothetical protein
MMLKLAKINDITKKILTVKKAKFQTPSQKIWPIKEVKSTL